MFVTLLKWEAGRSLNAMRRRRLGRRDRSGAEPPARWAAPPHMPAGGAHQLRSRRCAIPPGVDTHGWVLVGGSGRRHSQVAVLVGGSGGALHVTFCPGQGGRIRAATPCASAQLQHLATQDRRRVVLFGLNDPHFPLFALKREA